MNPTWLIAIGAVAMLVIAMVVLGRMLRGAPPRRRWANLLLPASQLALAVFMLVRIVAFQLPEWLFYLVVATTAACALGDVVLFRALLKAEQADEASERARLLEEQVEAQAVHRERLEADVREARHVREQLAQQLERTETLLVQHELGKASDQLERAEQVLGRGDGHYCEHRVVDALVAAKARACAEGDVRFECALEVPDNLPLPDVELCAVFSNVLDNALHACADVPAAERFITLHARVKGGFFLVEARNACVDGGSAASQPILPSHCRPGLTDHGWGLSIVQGVANRHAGKLTVGREGPTFQVFVALELPKP